MTLKELSDLLGLSPTTVSRALNGYPEVSEATRIKVAAAADAHGYAPNTRARALATGRAMAIGHVIPISAKHEMVNPIFADFTAGAGEVYSRNGYDMLMSVVSDQNEKQAYRSFATKRNVDGLIIHAPSLNDERIPFLNDLGLPYVVHGRSSRATAPYAWVDVNNTRAFRRATELLLDLGHTRIALLNGLEHMDFAARRRAGYEAALTARGITPDPALMFSAEMTEAQGHDLTRPLLATSDRPTAILVSSMIMAIGVRRGIEELGLTMGRDVSLITYDDDLSYFRNGSDIPVYTATRSSVRQAGQHAAQLLIDIINGNDSPSELLLEAELTLGTSTGPNRKS
ncbi:transcriptional regulator, LacI family [Aliiroseovarius halocynthiae]|uniref:LacI family DNA-binding transcriptional regulator n=1 Tax=Aliiroseovarius halocynthiae TaxID=985055 RepID=A0A545SWP4_9RHOB|nr:substrate-binding domain-containing protein [Aliiroseovarius halocynthiae]TQV69370.1 LacI family DNA-binding transcriptional regulator [Aliiroseovarius halocynthiae]SMR72621.1 transcriptional regulator, LacI family [Aliiroseovarius halocynthiae]